MKISICIPTYNRSAYLANCLNSIVLNKGKATVDFQVCISDNASNDATEEVVRRVEGRIPVTYHRNPSNLGIPRNFLNVVRMAQGEFVWLIGDDDLLLPSALQELNQLIDLHPAVDFFFVNSFHLTTDYIAKFPQPFDTSNLPADMTPFSAIEVSGKMAFFELVDPKVSFDFLGGMFLSVFRRRNWIENAGVLDPDAIADPRTFSHFDNTFPHVKVFAKAFSKSRAYFNANPLGVCLTGAREWAPLYPLVHSVRLVEALGEYRKNGLPYRRYWKCRNFALNNFIPDVVSIIVHGDRSGYSYISPLKLFLNNCLYPNAYLSVLNYCVRKARLLWRKHRPWGIVRIAEG